MAFKNNLLLDGNELHDNKELAFFLANNFGKSINYIKDGTIFGFFQNEDYAFYERLIRDTKDFEYPENVLTLLIYLLDNSLGIRTLSYTFNSNYEIAREMKGQYPTVIEEIKRLFYDKVLALIFWDKYKKTAEASYKRNYTFALHIYENHMYEFTYYYFLFLHLDKNETISFTLDGVKFKAIADMVKYLSENVSRATIIIDEIIHNPFIMALIAIKAGIEKIGLIMESRNNLEILKCLSVITNIDLIPIVKGRMAYWLITNYANYNYETDEAKGLFVEYEKIKQNLTLSSITDYVNVYDKVLSMYQSFIKMFNFNQIVSFQEGITATDEYYLCYRYNDEYVCEKFLRDNNLFDETIYSESYRVEVEREVLVEKLEKEKQEVIKFKEDVKELTKDISYNGKTFNHRKFISTMFLILATITFVAGLLIGTYKGGLVNYLALALNGVAFVAALIALVLYAIKDSDAELLDSVLASCDLSVEEIDREEHELANPSLTHKNYLTLSNLKKFKANRDHDYKKIAKINNKGLKLNSAVLIIAAVAFVIPATIILAPALLALFGKSNFQLVYFLDFNLLALIYLALYMALTIIFRKKNFAFYFIYLFIIVQVVLSLFLGH